MAEQLMKLAGKNPAIYLTVILLAAFGLNAGLDMSGTTSAPNDGLLASVAFLLAFTPGLLAYVACTHPDWRIVRIPVGSAALGSLVVTTLAIGEPTASAGVFGLIIGCAAFIVLTVFNLLNGGSVFDYIADKAGHTED